MIEHNLVLRPNCLLTRKPLVFISGPRSLFYHQNTATPARDYLEAHGYRVYCPPLPFRGALRGRALINFLDRQNEKKFHFFLSPETAAEMQSVLTNYPDSTVTLTSEFSDSAPAEPFLYSLHRLFLKTQGVAADNWKHTLNWHDLALCDRILDRCIELAENDHICET